MNTGAAMRTVGTTRRGRAGRPYLRSESRQVSATVKVDEASMQSNATEALGKRGSTTSNSARYASRPAPW